MLGETLVLGGDQHAPVNRVDQIHRDRQPPLAVGRKKAAQHRAVPRQHQHRQAAAALEGGWREGEAGGDQECDEHSRRANPQNLAPLSPQICPLSALGGGEGWGEVGDSRALAYAHLTLPTASRWVPSLSPLKGGEGMRAEPPYLHRGCTLSVPIAVRPVVSGSYMSSTTRA